MNNSSQSSLVLKKLGLHLQISSRIRSISRPNIPTVTMPAKVDMKRSMTSHNTWVKDSINRAERFMGDNPDGLTTSGDQKVAERLIEKIEENIANMKKKWTDVFVPQLEEEDPNNLLGEWDDKVHDISEQAENTIDELRKAIKTFVTKSAVTSTPPGDQDGNSTSRQRPKLVPDFKPGVLPNSANLSEFNAWEKSFLAYHNVNTNYLASADAATKRIFVTALLGDKIQAALDVDNDMKDEAIPIKGANKEEKSILHWVRDHILRYQPVYIRRYNYSMVKQNKNESFTDFWTRKVTKAGEAEIDTMTAKDFQIVELITSLNNTKLRDKCLEKKDPTLDELVEIGKTFDLQETVRKQNFAEVSANKTSNHEKVNKTTSDYKKGKNNAWQQQRGRDQSSNCDYCGRPKHKNKSDCKAKDSECGKCVKKGHFKEVCRGKPKRSSTPGPNKKAAESKIVKVS